ncbi:MAG: periplasmic heavy metal sensor [Alphaproteobacteria bacterium]|nr:periplasmic heavy metal sensor [Alphaproteobacteria bacterium]
MTAKVPRAFSTRILPWVLLTVSLALNAFFVGGHVYGRYYAEEVYGPAVASRLRDDARQAFARVGLQPEQRTAFRDLRRRLAGRGRELRSKSRETMEELWREMSSEAPDQARLETMIRSMADNRLTFQLEATRLAQEFMTTLTPEQRERFLEAARPRFLRLFGPIPRPSGAVDLRRSGPGRPLESPPAAKPGGE